MADYNLLGVSPYSFKAGGTISKGQPVKLDGTTARQVVACDAIADLCIGIAMIDASSGDELPIQTHGVAKCLAGATITINAEQMVEVTSGRVVDATGATARSIGVALQAAADGDLFEVLLAHLPNVKGPANS